MLFLDLWIWGHGNKFGSTRLFGVNFKTYKSKVKLENKNIEITILNTLFKIHIIPLI